MVVNQDHKYNDKDIRLAKFVRALSHPARVAILKYLKESGTCNCKNLVEKLPITQATVSQHLKELQDSGLIIANNKPPRVWYSVDNENWEMAKSMTMELMNLNF